MSEPLVVGNRVGGSEGAAESEGALVGVTPGIVGDATVGARGVGVVVVGVVVGVAVGVRVVGASEVFVHTRAPGSIA